MARNDDPRSIKSVLGSFQKSHARLDAGLANAKIAELWKSITGPGVTKYTKSTKLRSGTLTVQITSAPLRHELSFGKEQLMQRLNEEYGEFVVTKLILR